MGFAKAQWMEENERGWSSVGERRSVCGDCFNDSSIQRFIAERASETECDYCGRTDERPIAADADDVIGLIMESISTEWTDPVEELAYESAEGGYQGDMHDFWDVLEIVGNPIETAAFQEELERAVVGIRPVWCKRDYGALHLDEGLGYDWDTFVDQVKHKSRFLFLLDEKDLAYRGAGTSRTVLEMLEKLTRLAEASGLLSELPAGYELWRARPRRWWKHHRAARDLGTAPAGSQSNRMSPAGIPAFYGATRMEVAVAEVRASRGRTPWSVGRFKTTTPCSVLDLSELPEPPTIFDEARRHLRRPCSSFIALQRRSVGRSNSTVANTWSTSQPRWSPSTSASHSIPSVARGRSASSTVPLRGQMGSA
jgi:hypothetical protein